MGIDTVKNAGSSLPAFFYSFDRGGSGLVLWRWGPEIKKLCFGRAFYSFHFCGLFTRVDSTSGASIGASTAINAFVGVDFVDIAFGDSVGGTFAHAGTASNAVIANNVSHSFEFKN